MRVLTAEIGLLFLAADRSWQKIVWRWTNSSTENVLRNPGVYPSRPSGKSDSSLPDLLSKAFVSVIPSATGLLW